MKEIEGKEIDDNMRQSLGEKAYKIAAAAVALRGVEAPSVVATGMKGKVRATAAYKELSSLSERELKAWSDYLRSNPRP